MRRASWVHALAGGAFAAIASILTFHLGDVEFSYVRCAIFLLAWGWPIVLVLHLLWGQDRRRLGVLLAGYVGLLAGVCLIVALGDTPPLEWLRQHRTVLPAADLASRHSGAVPILSFSRHSRHRSVLSSHDLPCGAAAGVVAAARWPA
jgi:hypothetical protein